MEGSPCDGTIGGETEHVCGDPHGLTFTGELYQDNNSGGGAGFFPNPLLLEKGVTF